MGCHTWFYKKLEQQPTKEEKINCFIEREKRFRAKVMDALENGGFSYGGDERDWYPFEDAEEAREYIELVDWKIENAPRYEDFREDYESIDWYRAACSNSCLSREQELYSGVEDYRYNDDVIMTKHNGEYYVEVEGYGDVFRYHEYGRVITSKEETYALLEEDNCVKYDNTYERVDDFWEKYPDGIIELG